MTPRSRSTRSTITVCVVLGLISAACGSTLPQAQEDSVQVSEAGALGAGILPPGARINEQGQVVNSEGEVLGTAEEFGLAVDTSDLGDPARAVGGSSTESSGTEGTTTPGVNGPGVTAKTITLGLRINSGYSAGARAAGIGAIGSFDYERAWHALLDYQNAHGGIAGRQIIPVFFDLNANSSKTYAQQEQEACAQWTQDRHIFAALTTVYSNNLLECLHNAEAVLTSQHSTSTLSITPQFQSYPYYVEPVALALDRDAAVMVAGLDRMDYFEKGATFGLVTFDDPRFKYAVSKGLMPALRSRGVELAEAAYLSTPGNFSELAQTSNDAVNAALRFKSAGIDHVIFVDYGATGSWLFMQAAERQEYRPRYGLSRGGVALVELLRGDARNQLHGALSVSWTPAIDTLEADDPDADNPTRVLCLSIMRKAGVDVSSTAAKLGALSICDALWSTAAALRGATVVNRDTYLAGMNSLRGAYSPATTWSTYIDASLHDGVSAAANLRFVDGCTCFRYLGRPYPIR